MFFYLENRLTCTEKNSPDVVDRVSFVFIL